MAFSRLLTCLEVFIVVALLHRNVVWRQGKLPPDSEGSRLDAVDPLLLAA